MRRHLGRWLTERARSTRTMAPSTQPLVSDTPLQFHGGLFNFKARHVEEWRPFHSLYTPFVLSSSTKGTTTSKLVSSCESSEVGRTISMRDSCQSSIPMSTVEKKIASSVGSWEDVHVIPLHPKPYKFYEHFFSDMSRCEWSTTQHLALSTSHNIHNKQWNW